MCCQSIRNGSTQSDLRHSQVLEFGQSVDRDCDIRQQWSCYRPTDVECRVWTAVRTCSPCNLGLYNCPCTVEFDPNIVCIAYTTVQLYVRYVIM